VWNATVDGCSIDPDGSSIAGRTDWQAGFIQASDAT
jgi:hypothetical protein